MPSLSRSVSGLLYQSDGSLTDWALIGTGWTSDATNPVFVCYPLPEGLLTPNVDSLTIDGVREAQLYIESGVWYLLYDAGNHITGWRQFIAKSLDRGLTWNRLGPLDMNLNKVISGTWGAVANGWMAKVSSTYYALRAVAVNTFAAPNIGLPAIPYYGDCWTNSTLGASGWSASANVPSGNQRYDLGGSATADILPSCLIMDGGNALLFSEGSTGSFWTIGISTGSNPDGPFTPYSTIICDKNTANFGGRQPENPKVFYSATLGQWCMLVNLIALDLTRTDQNAIGYSFDKSDWSAATWWPTQDCLNPIDSQNGNTSIGVGCHVTGPSGALVEGPNGEVPMTFDGNALRYATASIPWHIGRTIRTAVLEPAASNLRFVGDADSGTSRLVRALTLTDCVIECAVWFDNIGLCEFGIEYRMDIAGTTYYRAGLGVSGFSFFKVVSGTPSTLATNSGSLVGRNEFMHRVKIIVSGNTHTMILDGETQIVYTDNSSPITSGVFLSVAGLPTVHGDFNGIVVRRLTVRTNDVLTITGLSPGMGIVLRSYGGFLAGSGVANASGQAQITMAHWPHYALEGVLGTDYTVSNALWGGDTVNFSGLAQPIQAVIPRVWRR